MRVIAGKLRGRRLQTLPGEATRPTLEKVKEALFSSVQFQLPGARVLDLFAGSGQLGIEALSRGAAFAVFIDSSPAAAAVVSANCRACGVWGDCRVATMTAEGFLAANRELFDVVLMDPPYRRDLLPGLLQAVGPHVAAGGLVLCESEPQAQLPPAAGGLVLCRQRRYGAAMLSRYEKEAQPDEAGRLPGQF